MQSEKGCSVNKEAEEMPLNTHITKRKLMLTDYTIMYKNSILHKTTLVNLSNDLHSIFGKGLKIWILVNPDISLNTTM